MCYVLYRPSVALQRLTACCRTIQYATSLLPGADLTCVIGQALFKEVCENVCVHKMKVAFVFQREFPSMYVCTFISFYMNTDQRCEDSCSRRSDAFEYGDGEQEIPRLQIIPLVVQAFIFIHTLHTYIHTYIHT